MDKNIELELRAEIPIADKALFHDRLAQVGAQSAHTRRLSVMFFGEINDVQRDIRVRVTNSVCEVVMKSGSLGAHDRTEIAQEIRPEEFLGMVKIFAHCGFVVKVGERESVDYALPDNVTASLVSAGSIAYTELEKMSAQHEVTKNTTLLHTWAERLALQLLTSEKEFDALCARLSETIDWPFHGTADDYAKLDAVFDTYR